MKANTALGLVMAGVSLWLSTTRDGYSRTTTTLAAVAGTLGLVTLIQDIIGWNTGIDELLFVDATADGWPGRMAPNTAFCFVAFGAAVAVAHRGNRLWLAHTIALVSVLITLVALIGYLYDVEALYSVGTLRTIAFHTALFHLLLAVGLLFAYPSGGLMTSIVSDSLGGTMARRLLPIAIVLPVVAGWLRLQGQSAGLYGLGFGVALMAVSSIIAVAAMIWWSATSLGHMEAERRRTEKEFSAHLRDILDTALDAVVSIDATSRITYWNRRAEEVFGWSRSEAVGQDLSTMIMPERYREAHHRGLDRFRTTGEGPILGRRIEIAALRRNGTEFPIELTISALKDSGELAFNAFIADISDRRRAEEELRVGQEHMASLLRLSHRLERATTFTDVLQAALEEITRQMGFRSVWAFLLSEKGDTASLITIEGELADTVRRSLPTLTVKGDRFLEAIFAATEPVVVEDARIDPRTDKAIVESLQNRTIINAPLLLADKRIGAVGTGSFGDEGVRVPTTRQLNYFAAMSTHIAAAFDRIRLLDERARINEDLERRVVERTAQLACSRWASGARCRRTACASPRPARTRPTASCRPTTAAACRPPRAPARCAPTTACRAIRSTAASMASAATSGARATATSSRRRASRATRCSSEARAWGSTTCARRRRRSA
jgi:PAS domain S-box-containing protein